MSVSVTHVSRSKPALVEHNGKLMTAGGNPVAFKIALGSTSTFGLHGWPSTLMHMSITAHLWIEGSTSPWFATIVFSSADYNNPVEALGETYRLNLPNGYDERLDDEIRSALQAAFWLD